MGLQTASRERACHERFVSSYKRTKNPQDIYLDTGLPVLEISFRDGGGEEDGHFLSFLERDTAGSAGRCFILKRDRTISAPRRGGLICALPARTPSEC